MTISIVRARIGSEPNGFGQWHSRATIMNLLESGFEVECSVSPIITTVG